MRLKHRDNPNPIEVDADRADLYKASGWAEVDDQPAGNASLDAWVTYATAQGASEDELHGRTRGDLIEKYG